MHVGMHMIVVLLPAVGIEPRSRYQRPFLRRKPYTTRLSKNLSNSISTSVTEWYKVSVVRRFFGTATWVRFSPPVKGLRSYCEYRPGLYYEPFPRRLRLPRPTLPLEYVFTRIRSTHLRWCARVWMATLWSTYLGFRALNSRMNSITPTLWSYSFYRRWESNPRRGTKDPSYDGNLIPLGYWVCVYCYVCSRVSVRNGHWHDIAPKIRSNNTW